MMQQYTFEELESLPEGTLVRCIYFKNNEDEPRFDEKLFIFKDEHYGGWVFKDESGSLFCDMSPRENQDPKQLAEEHTKGVFRVLKV